MHNFGSLACLDAVECMRIWCPNRVRRLFLESRRVAHSWVTAVWDCVLVEPPPALPWFVLCVCGVCLLSL